MIMSQLEEWAQGGKEEEEETLSSRSVGFPVLCMLLSAIVTLSSSLHTKLKQQYQKLPTCMPE